MPRVGGCKCPECYGLAEYMAELTGKDYGLMPAPGHAPLPPELACDGSYTCACDRCAAERRSTKRGGATTGLDRYTRG